MTQQAAGTAGSAQGEARPEGAVENYLQPDLYLNRHLSLMQFNLRVLEQALNDQYPLLERLQFLLIFSSNLDEFHEIRVAELKRQISFSREVLTTDGMQPQDVLKELNGL